MVDPHSFSAPLPQYTKVVLEQAMICNYSPLVWLYESPSSAELTSGSSGQLWESSVCEWECHHRREQICHLVLSVPWKEKQEKCIQVMERQKIYSTVKVSSITISTEARVDCCVFNNTVHYYFSIAYIYMQLGSAVAVWIDSQSFQTRYLIFHFSSCWFPPATEICLEYGRATP